MVYSVVQHVLSMCEAMCLMSEALGSIFSPIKKKKKGRRTLQHFHLPVSLSSDMVAVLK
jgi:hypothetical protein